MKNNNTNKFKVYSDLPCQMAGNGTIPVEACVTSEKPDVVIVDQKRKTLDILELIVPFERFIEVRHKEKIQNFLSGHRKGPYPFLLKLTGQTYRHNTFYI